MRTAIDPALARRAVSDGAFFFAIVIVSQIAGHLPAPYGADLSIAAGVAVLRYLYLRWRSTKASM